MNNNKAKSSFQEVQKDHDVSVIENLNKATRTIKLKPVIATIEKKLSDVVMEGLEDLTPEEKTERIAAKLLNLQGTAKADVTTVEDSEELRNSLAVHHEKEQQTLHSLKNIPGASTIPLSNSTSDLKYNMGSDGSLFDTTNTSGLASSESLNKKKLDHSEDLDLNIEKLHISYDKINEFQKFGIVNKVNCEFQIKTTNFQNKLTCVNSKSTQKSIENFPVDLNRIVQVEFNGRFSTIYIAKEEDSSKQQIKLKKVNVEFINKELSKEFSLHLLFFSSKGQLDLVFKKSCIIFLQESKEEENLKTLLQVLTIAKKPFQIIHVDFKNKNLILNKLDNINWNDSNSLTCIGTIEVFNEISLKGTLTEFFNKKKTLHLNNEEVNQCNHQQKNISTQNELKTKNNDIDSHISQLDEINKTDLKILSIVENTTSNEKNKTNEVVEISTNFSLKVENNCNLKLEDENFKTIKNLSRPTPVDQ
ncbi:hypothetical protein HDU92_002147, partial [Lobulomyces angularis]